MADAGLEVGDIRLRLKPILPGLLYGIPPNQYFGTE